MSSSRPSQISRKVCSDLLPEQGQECASADYNAPEIREATCKPKIILRYISTKGGVDQMAHAYTIKRRLKRWPLVMFYNIIDLRPIATRVFWQASVPSDKLSHDDNRQLFIIAAAEELVLQQVQRRASIANLSVSIKQNIDTILASFRPRPPKRASDPQNQKKRHKRLSLLTATFLGAGLELGPGVA
ncbi:hypothetical protein RRG08_015592 [Elysia crispata]|uniref:Uncharacterized protein n=1 Tax=Elysia crispata TaxID=231223 RepID=A0AAE1CX44_9GAST|nr:hypothetical protein RRG08_015592 [Elysia crispata]